MKKGEAKRLATMTPKPFVKVGWGLAWYSNSRLDGEEYRIIGDVFFKTRREVLWHREAKYSYISRRPDLLSEPHGWQLPRVVKVRWVIEQLVVEEA